MNWILIFVLSLFGVAVAFTGVYGITTQQTEPLIWLVIIVIYAIIIAKGVSGRYFLQGFLVSTLGGIWVAGIRVAYFHTYMRANPGMKRVYDSMPHFASPKITMIIMYPLIGAVFGLLSGLLALIAARIMKKKPVV